MQGTRESGAERSHAISVEGRRKATVTGVQDVECFNEEIVVLNTAAGALTITGEGLNIPELRLDEGRLVVEGDVRSLEYDGRLRDGKGGLFGRLFR